MEQTIQNLLQFTPDIAVKDKHKNIQAIHFDYSGHVVATNGHVLFATKKPFEMKKAGKTFSSSEIKKGVTTESIHEFPEWKKAIPSECARKIKLTIPKWFSMFKKTEEDVTLVLDYKNVDDPFFKVSKCTSETSLGINAKYLSCFAGEEVSVLLSSPTSAAVITKKDSKIDPHSNKFEDEVLSEEWFYLLMPIRLDEAVSEVMYM